MQFNLRAASGTADETRIEHTRRAFRRVDGAPATYAILSKADIRLRRNICRSGPLAEVGRSIR
jgi:hypothetical protein